MTAAIGELPRWDLLRFEQYRHSNGKGQHLAYRRAVPAVLLATEDAVAVPTAVAVASVEHHRPHTRFVVATYGLTHDNHQMIEGAAPNVDLC